MCSIESELEIIRTCPAVALEMNLTPVNRIQRWLSGEWHGLLHLIKKNTLQIQATRKSVGFFSVNMYSNSQSVHFEVDW
jgi:hypothetical protein